jgi:hypothetical protein
MFTPDPGRVLVLCLSFMATTLVDALQVEKAAQSFTEALKHLTSGGG